MLKGIKKSHNDEINQKRSKTMIGQMAGDKNPMFG